MEGQTHTDFLIGNQRILLYSKDRSIFVNDHFCRFTKMEYHLLVSLLPGSVVPDSQLLDILGSSQQDPASQKALEKHIDNIRSKLKLLQVNIYRVIQYGYVLLEELPRS